MAVQGLQPVSSGYALTDSGRAWCRLGFELRNPANYEASPTSVPTGRSGAITSRANSLVSSTCTWWPMAGCGGGRDGMWR